MITTENWLLPYVYMTSRSVSAHNDTSSNSWSYYIGIFRDNFSNAISRSFPWSARVPRKWFKLSRDCSRSSIVLRTGPDPSFIRTSSAANRPANGSSAKLVYWSLWAQPGEWKSWPAAGARFPTRFSKKTQHVQHLTQSFSQTFLHIGGPQCTQGQGSAEITWHNASTQNETPEKRKAVFVTRVPHNGKGFMLYLEGQSVFSWVFTNPVRMPPWWPLLIKLNWYPVF